MSDAASIIERIGAEGIRTVDFRFTDLAGRWRHVGREAGGVDAELLAQGVFIDGSAIPGWRDVTEADLLLRPDLASAFADPFAAQPTLVLICDAAEPGTGLGYERDPRSAACGPRPSCAAAATPTRSGSRPISPFPVRRGQGRARAAARPLQPRLRRAWRARDGHRPGPDAAYLALPPADQMADIRAEIASVLARPGRGRAQARPRAGRGQNQICCGAGGLVAAADRLQT